MDLVGGVAELQSAHGPLFAVIGVFDGLHRGHAYLLDHLVRAARARDARPAVITFDHHPDEVLTGTAPPLLMDPDERLERLAAAGVAVTVVQHFDDAVRRTTYDAFVGSIDRGAGLAGLLMTPDAAFGFERRGTPDALAALGARDGFDVVVVPPFSLGGGVVRSTEIRELIRAGRLEEASELLGRPFALTGLRVGDSLTFAYPMAMPPDGTYRAHLGEAESRISVRDGRVILSHRPTTDRVTVELLGGER